MCLIPSPKPIYDSEDLENQPINNFEHLIHTIHSNTNDVYISTGDLNQMDIGMFEIDLCFVQLLKYPTQKTNVFDTLLTNRPDRDVQVIQYLVKIKHKAILVNCE